VLFAVIYLLETVLRKLLCNSKNKLFIGDWKMKNIKKIIMIFIMIATIAITFNSKYDSLIKEFESTAESKQANLEDHIKVSSNFIEFVTIFGDDFFKKEKGKDSELYNILKYNPNSNNYNLDSVSGTQYEKTVGNLTGVGNIPDSGINKNEMNLAFQYNEFFNKFYSKFPDAAWLYYTSENNFINIYPWVSSKDFTFTEDLKTREFYKYVNPQNNPLRKALWTPTYLDHAGKGLMVTLSSPIYDKDTFKGVVSIDLTTKVLSEIINSKYETYLIDDTNSVIAKGGNVIDDKEVTKLSSLINISESEIIKLKEAENNSVQRFGKYYIYSARFSDTNWNMLEFVSASFIIGNSLLFTLPIIIICIILFFAINEIEIRKKTEKNLKSMAITDQLTGLNNRHLFEEKALEEINRSDRYNRPLSMIIFDLDYFKRINDTWGHPIGDEVLRKTAEITRKHIRKTDMIFRLGGEEFIILLPETNLIGAQKVAQKLRDALDSNIHPIIGKFTASFGVGERKKYESVKNWYKNVDQALYNAKNEGRNCVVSSLESKIMNITTVYIKWKSEWESGNMIIDEQHIKLIEMTNELLDMSCSVVNSEKIMNYFDVYLEYLVNHIYYEEKIIVKIGYMDFDKHFNKHRKLVNEVIKFKEENRNKKLIYSEFFKVIVNDVIIEHIIKEDVEFFPYIKKHLE
jgi:diguanylate cyclase (GGDEF)-like protein/hemerythrin-like metal-binding protein